MAERMIKRRQKLIKSASTESSEIQFDLPVKRKIKKPKERWLLTRKTWRYMADAGRKLIPDGTQNRPEDIPQIESYFQEVCKKEPRFLLWRKNSYPGALGFRKKRKDRRKGGSCRKACSADEVDDIKPQRPKDLPLYASTSGGRFDIQKMKYDFLNSPVTPSTPRTKSAFNTPTHEDDDESMLVNMLETYLKISEGESVKNFDYQMLIDKLQQHLVATHIPVQTETKLSPKRENVHFEGDHLQKSLTETLNRYFSQNVSRDRIISDLLTNRKALQKLYFDLRQTRGFKGRRDYSYTPPNYLWDQSMLRSTKNKQDISDYRKSVPPPLIEIQGESVEPVYVDGGIQTDQIPDEDLCKIEEEYKKLLAEREEEERDSRPSGSRRKSSVDHDDVSQSVSDTIKRYLRMARKKSADSDKVDRFKRVNYDRNLRNIKAKGEITKPGDDDGLNKGCQTNDEWILTYRDLKFESALDSSSSTAYYNNPSEEAIHPNSPTTKSHSFLSHLLNKHSHDKSSAGLAMQKSKSSSSVVHHGSRLMAKTIFKRSKSQSRTAQQPSTWTPKGSCIWTSVTGKQVILADTTLQHLSDVERKILQKVALDKLQALNLGVTVKVPSDNVVVVPKKRRPYLLKRKALTTGIFDTSRKDADKDKGAGSGLVFGIPLSQCIDNDRVRAVGNACYASGDEQRPMARTGSRASFSSLIDSTIRQDEKGSCDSLSRDNRIAGSVPGLLDAILCSSSGDITGSTSNEEEKTVPHIITECIRHLEIYGLYTLGIFRVSTSKKRVRQLREDFDSGKESVLNIDQCPHDVATLLKEYLRDLPDPLLCRDLYSAFVQTQRIRNRRLQLEALQHLVQLLPSVNRDTLLALLNFLANVAKHSADQTDALGEVLLGNKMNSTNLATIFAPNILHAIKPGSKDPSERSDDRIDVINVIRTMIDNSHNLFAISAEMLDEIYVHMMDTNPDELDVLLNKRETIGYADESQDEISDGSLRSPGYTTGYLEDGKHGDDDPYKPKKTYSREECLHETAATGGPNVAMRIRHKERIKERSLKKRRDESASRLRKDEDSGSSTSSISRSRDGIAYAKTRSSSLESSCSLPGDDHRVMKSTDEQQSVDRRKSTPYFLDQSGILTASLTIPVQTSSLNIDEDIPYIEDSYNYSDGKHQMIIGMVKPTAPPRRRHRSTSGSDSSVASAIQPITGSISFVQQGYDSAIGSSLTYSSPPHNTAPSSIASSIADASGMCSSPPSWASTPPTSPDSHNTSVNYIPDDIQHPKYLTKKTTTKESPMLHKVTYTSTSEIQRAGKPADIRRDIPMRKKSVEIQKCSSSPVFTEQKERFNPSITSIGNAVLRSRTADFERITQTSTETKTTTTTTTISEKKKYNKRRYTDSRHQTRHIPDAESLESQTKKDIKSSTNVSQTVYKRRELISSVPTESR
ncbi:PREDICTED: uncharacterized protein LOC108556706 [Nicrophorus vespilloides]|uniref:Uncharacterized protein LOC108556706 n=1 Tax=Nicrophorus vespilloides TaxID=110193 RepID=A0ABM1M1F5_NICVS|nr:PREDICTED: uncharacterized protein LOC108556706 [Nicrophorus vespilloides]